ncbi:hypothetical protein F2P81_023339 [Scophthalmus maximus]|uniref:Uncharacterized protein n=1 Tax=Scophthalmus maximus TaxID=52904 RepID=A0A6A4RVY9_SCOMX|nr:hypothetical protein F2P81_023339 [Scophthalmus maximus]
MRHNYDDVAVGAFVTTPIGIPLGGAFTCRQKCRKFSRSEPNPSENLKKLLNGNVPVAAAAAAAAGEDALRLLLTGAEQLIVWQILNSTHLRLDILTYLIPPVSLSLFALQRLNGYLKVSSVPELLIGRRSTMSAVTQASLPTRPQTNGSGQDPM